MVATQVFARFAHEASQRALPPEVLHHAQRAVIDWYASLYPGLAMPAIPLRSKTSGRGTAGTRTVADAAAVDSAASDVRCCPSMPVGVERTSSPRLPLRLLYRRPRTPTMHWTPRIDLRFSVI